MFECYMCHTSYVNEDEAHDCCRKATGSLEDDTYRMSHKKSVKPGAIQHQCPNVSHRDRVWLTWVRPDESCPMCEYVYRPR